MVMFNEEYQEMLARYVRVDEDVVQLRMENERLKKELEQLEDIVMRMTNQQQIDGTHEAFLSGRLY